MMQIVIIVKFILVQDLKFVFVLVSLLCTSLAFYTSDFFVNNLTSRDVTVSFRSTDL